MGYLIPVVTGFLIVCILTAGCTMIPEPQQPATGHTVTGPRMPAPPSPHGLPTPPVPETPAVSGKTR